MQCLSTKPHQWPFSMIPPFVAHLPTCGVWQARGGRPSLSLVYIRILTRDNCHMPGTEFGNTVINKHIQHFFLCLFCAWHCAVGNDRKQAKERKFRLLLQRQGTWNNYLAMPGSFCTGKKSTGNFENLQGANQYFGSQNGRRVWPGRRTTSLVKESPRFGSLVNHFMSLRFLVR